MSSRKCATICHISLICDMPLFIYKSKPHGNGPAAMKKDTIDKLIGRIDHIKEEDLQRFFVKLAEQQGFFQQVFEAIQEGLILLDNKGRLLYFPGQGLLMGHDPAEPDRRLPGHGNLLPGTQIPEHFHFPHRQQKPGPPGPDTG